jgi:hypothetical protein
VSHDPNCATFARDLCDCRGVAIIVRLTLRPSRRVPKMYLSTHTGARALLRRIGLALEAVRRDVPIAWVLEERRAA